MAEIIDLEMSDEEYLQLIAQGRDPVSEKLYQRQLAKMCTFLEDGALVLPRLGQPREAPENVSVSTRACRRFYNYLVRQPRNLLASASDHL